MFITLTVKNEVQGGHIPPGQGVHGREKEIGSIHYENEQDKEWLLMEGHSNVTLMGSNDKATEAPEGEYRPYCLFGAMIDSFYEAEQKKSGSWSTTRPPLVRSASHRFIAISEPYSPRKWTSTWHPCSS